MLGAACTDQVTDSRPPPDAATRTTSAPSDSSSPARIDEVPVLSRFDVEVRAEGSFQPGRPIRIIASVEANLTSPQTEIRITAPEASAAQQSGWDEAFRVPVGTPLPALGRSTQRLASQQRVQRTAELVVPAPGLYSVIVGVHDSSRPRAQESGGRPVQKEGVAEVWIEVTERGGRAVPHFDPALIPAGMRPESGPFRHRGHGPGGEARPSRSPGAASRSLVPGTRGGDGYRALYRYTYAGSVFYWAQQEATVLVRYFDNSGSVVDMSALVTDEEGYYTVPCRSSAWSRYEAVLLLENDKVRMLGLGSLPAGTGTSAWCGTSPVISQTRYEGAKLHPWVFANMRVAAIRTEQLFGARHPRIDVQMGYSSTEPSYYSRFDDRITIQEREALAERGVFATAHEYGHAFHEKALGGIRGMDCPAAHFFDGAHTLGCAFSEGVADYVAAITRSELRYPFQVNQYYPAVRGSGNWYDGSLIEGPVAAFLLDLTDEHPDFYPEEPFDPLSVSPVLVADLVRTCEVRTWQGWARASGVDHLVYCLEGAVDASLYAQGYFTTRGLPPYEARMSTAYTRPTPGDVRALWIKNLYDPARQPPAGGAEPTEPLDPGTGGASCSVDVRGMATCTDA